MINITDLSVTRSVTFSLSIPRLTIEAGSILCIAGPNGCGKTTLIECIMGLLTPVTGSVTIDGHHVTHNLRSLKARTGLIPDDEAWLIGELCAEEYLAVLRSIYEEAGVRSNMQQRAAELADILQFDMMHQPLQSLSHGNKKKVQIIAALMHNPRVIIVDELRNGLDPLASRAAEKLLQQLAAAGSCIIATTHDLWWAERIADHLLLLRSGVVASYDTTKHVVHHYGSVENFYLQLMETS